MGLLFGINQIKYYYFYSSNLEPEWPNSELDLSNQICLVLSTKRNRVTTKRNSDETKLSRNKFGYNSLHI